MSICVEHTTIVEKLTEIKESVIRTEGNVEKLDLRINGTLEKMGVHVEDFLWWRRFILGTAIGLIISIFGGVIALATLCTNLGEYTKQIKVNTDRLAIIETEHREVHRGAL